MKGDEDSNAGFVSSALSFLLRCKIVVPCSICKIAFSIILHSCYSGFYLQKNVLSHN